MSEGTKIQWCDDTANFWRGCTKVSDGCKNCYAEKNIGVKMNGIKWGKGAARVLSKSAFDEARRWNKKPWVCDKCGNTQTNPTTCEKCGLSEFDSSYTFHRRRVFSLSLGDIWDAEVPIEYLAAALRVVFDCPNLDFLLLTKRPENFFPRVEAVWKANICENRRFSDWLRFWGMDGKPPQNVWIGVSVENQKCADERIPLLLKIPAKIRFLSCEPLLSPVELSRCLPDENSKNSGDGFVDWVIVGGESGPNARPCNIEWIRSIVKQCKSAGTACFVKQLGAFPVTSEITPDGWPVGTELQSGCPDYRLIKLRDKKGGDMTEWPEDLRVREFPV